MLAVRLLQRQGIDVHAVTFKSVFFDSVGAEKAGISLKIPVRIEDFTETILSIIDKPKHGYGAGMNPCIDCHTAMLRRAAQIMTSEGFHFLSTGEVLGQRPFSQNRHALDLVESESGCSGYVIRPLSAKLLPPSTPELRGWINREQLLDLQGRGRKPQLKLAAHFGISDYPQPAGGCLLTDPGYSVRLKDLRSHEGLEDINQIRLLRAGRHFRIGGIKLIVGRNEGENEVLETSRGDKDILLKCEKFPGPSAVIGHRASERELELAASICARYGDCPRDRQAEITAFGEAEKKVLKAVPADDSMVDLFIIR